MKRLLVLLVGATVACVASPGSSGSSDAGRFADAGPGPDGGQPSTDAGIPLTGVLGETVVGPDNCGQPPTPDAGVLSAVVAGNTALGLQLLPQLASTSSSGNVFLSPLSISTAMAMVSEGAQGSTASQIAQYLDFAVTGQPLADGMGALACQLEADGEAPDGGTIAVANAVFSQQGDDFEAPFETTLADSFGAPFTPVDFADNPDGVRQAIDQWVSSQTSGMIPQLLGPGSVTPDMKLVLVDALYFNELWATPFDPATDGPFHVSAQNTIQVPTMTDVVFGTGYYSDSNVTFAELPFGNSHEAIDFLLPGSGKTLAQLTAGLSVSGLQGWISSLAPQQVLVSIPKFKIDWSASLIPAFQALGLTAPFDPSQANFAGIDGQMDLYISLLKHEAVLQVGEAGVTAAAATVTGLAGSAAPGWTETFAANQPFLVLIRDVPTGMVLFIGQVTDPSGS